MDAGAVVGYYRLLAPPDEGGIEGVHATYGARTVRKEHGISAVEHTTPTERQHVGITAVELYGVALRRTHRGAAQIEIGADRLVNAAQVVGEQSDTSSAARLHGDIGHVHASIERVPFS